MGESSLWGLVLGEHCLADGEAWGWVIYPLVMLYSFYVLAQLCDGHLTTALEYIVDRIRISEDVAGATFLAMASSAPEIFTSLISTFIIVSGSGAGTVGAACIVGSALFNLLVIIGVVPIFASVPLRIWWYPTVRDAAFYAAAILELFFVLDDGQVWWHEGLIMVLSYLVYIAYFTKNAVIVSYFDLSPDNSVSEATRGATTGKAEQDEDQGPRAAEVARVKSPSSAPSGDTGGTDSEVSTLRSRSADEIPESPAATSERFEELPDMLGAVPRERGALERERPEPGHEESRREPPPRPPPASRPPISRGSSSRSSPEGSIFGPPSAGGAAAAPFGPPKPQLRSNDSRNGFGLRGRPTQCAANLTKVMPLPSAESEPASLVTATDSEISEERVPGVLPDGVPDGIQEEPEHEQGWLRFEPVMLFINSTMPCRRERLYTLFALCCWWIGVFTYFAVDAASRLGKCVAKIDDVVMGLLVLAAGTSVPDAMGSIAVAKSGMGDMAVANAVGSNTFDILLGLGLPWGLKSAIDGAAIEMNVFMLREAVLVLAGCLAGYLCLITLHGWILTRTFGVYMLSVYVGVIVFLLVWYKSHA